MIQELEIKEKLIALKLGLVSLADLEDWLGDASWGMHLDSPKEAVSLASDVHLAFSAHDAGYLNDEQLLFRLIDLVSDNSVIVVGAPSKQAPKSASLSAVLVVDALPNLSMWRPSSDQLELLVA